MSDSDPLLPYVLAWEAAVAAGRYPTPDELCADEPHLAPALAARLAALGRTGTAGSLPFPADLDLPAPTPHDESLRQDTRPSIGPPVAGRPYPDQVGDYKLLGLLGQGGMGAVFRAEDVRLGRQVALKLILPAYAGRPKAKARFLREARAQANIDHDNVVPIYQVGEQDNHLFIAMPLLQGETLRSRLHRTPSPPLDFVLRVGAELADGLAAAHAKGVIHRDMKPGNVWLEGEPGGHVRRCRILDFGLARANEETSARVTGAGEVLGTPAYMSPEQAACGKVDERTDLFPLGVMLYEMLTGRQPFEGPSAVATLVNVATQNPPPAHAVNPAVPEPLSDLVFKMMAKTPSLRPATAREVADALRTLTADYFPPPTAVAAGSGRTPTASGRPVPAAPPRSWRAILLVAGGLLVCAAAAVGGYYLVNGPVREEIPGPPPSTGGPKPPPVTSDGEKPNKGNTPDPPVLPAVTLRVDPPGASVRTVGPNPVTVPGAGGLFVFRPAPAAKFTARVEADGFEPTDVPIDTAATTEYPVTLTPSRVRVAFRPFPESATADFPAAADARPVPLAPGEFDARRGKYDVTVRLPGMKPAVLAVAPDRAAKRVDLIVPQTPNLPPQSITDTAGLTLQYVPAGSFEMPLGKSSKTDALRRQVTITKPFYMGRTEITRGQFKLFVMASGHQTTAEKSPTGGAGYTRGDPEKIGTVFGKQFSWRNPGFDQEDNHPVVNVSWADADAYCKWLSVREGKTYRLPTEAEWEYAARAGSEELLPFDPADVTAHANVADQAMFRRLTEDNPGLKIDPKLYFPGEDGWAFTAPVGSFRPNAFGLADMYGNAMEFCRDWYGDLAELPARDPVQEKQTPAARRVVRGGSFRSGETKWFTGRLGLQPDRVELQVGFRVCLEITPGK